MPDDIDNILYAACPDCGAAGPHPVVAEDDLWTGECRVCRAEFDVLGLQE